MNAPTVSNPMMGMDKDTVELLKKVLPFVEGKSMTKGELAAYVGESYQTIDELIAKPGFPHYMNKSKMMFWQPSVAWYMFTHQIYS